VATRYLTTTVVVEVADELLTLQIGLFPRYCRKEGKDIQNFLTLK
jgi:hypothetical protein